MPVNADFAGRVTPRTASRRHLREHMEVTKGHVERIEQLFESMEMHARSRPCKGMRGIVEEGQEGMAEDREAALTDAAIIAAGRRVGHYEMAAYENLRDMVRQMGSKEAAGMIEETLREEIQADKQLAQIGKRLFKEATRPRAEEAEQRSARAAVKRSSRGTGVRAKSAGRSKSQATGGNGRRSHLFDRSRGNPAAGRRTWSAARAKEQF
jgi:ferritin-like metal-binding protein YciE